MSELENIWDDSKGSIPQDKLDAYLEGRLTPEEQLEVESYLSDAGMESDAIEGLNELDKKEIDEIAAKVNYKLQHELRKQSHRRRKLFTDNKWGWLAVCIIIFLLFICYYLMYSIK